jgi:hypothetical protein
MSIQSSNLEDPSDSSPNHNKSNEHQESEAASPPISGSVSSTGGAEGCPSDSGCVLRSSDSTPFPMLDKGGRNPSDKLGLGEGEGEIQNQSHRIDLVSQRSSVLIPFAELVTNPKRPWTKKHRKAKRLLGDLLLYWQRLGLQRHFLTLTSAPESTGALLRKHFQNLRYRSERHCGWQRNSIKYRCVDTDEGHGVLHIILALPIAPNAFWMNYGLLGEWWLELHGARQIRTIKIGDGYDHAGKLSHYVVRQYVGDQDLTIRTSGSRLPMNFTKFRKDVQASVFQSSAKYEMPEASCLKTMPMDDPSFQGLYAAWRSSLWRLTDRTAKELLLSGKAMLHGRQYVLLLEPVAKIVEV